MRHSRLPLLAFVCLWLPVLAGPAQAQKPTLDSRIDVRVEAMPAVDVFRQIINGLGYELQMDAAIEAPVTLWISRISARTALNVVCESVGCAWRTEGNRLIVGWTGGASARSDGKFMMVGTVRRADADKQKVVMLDLPSRLKKPLPVDMQFQDVPVSTILRAMSDASGLEITADEPLASRHVTLTGSGKTVEDALKAVIEQAGGGAVTMFTIRDAANRGAPAVKIAIKTRDGTIKKDM